MCVRLFLRKFPCYILTDLELSAAAGPPCLIPLITMQISINTWRALTFSPNNNGKRTRNAEKKNGMEWCFVFCHCQMTEFARRCAHSHVRSKICVMYRLRGTWHTQHCDAYAPLVREAPGVADKVGRWVYVTISTAPGQFEALSRRSLRVHRRGKTQGKTNPICICCACVLYRSPNQTSLGVPQRGDEPTF